MARTKLALLRLPPDRLMNVLLSPGNRKMSSVILMSVNASRLTAGHDSDQQISFVIDTKKDNLGYQASRCSLVCLCIAA